MTYQLIAAGGVCAVIAIVFAAHVYAARVREQAADLVAAARRETRLAQIAESAAIGGRRAAERSEREARAAVDALLKTEIKVGFSHDLYRRAYRYEYEVSDEITRRLGRVPDPRHVFETVGKWAGAKLVADILAHPRAQWERGEAEVRGELG